MGLVDKNSNLVLPMQEACEQNVCGTGPSLFEYLNPNFLMDNLSIHNIPKVVSPVFYVFEARLLYSYIQTLLQ